MASTDPVNRAISDHPVYQLDPQNSSNNAVHAPEAVFTPLSDDDEQSVVNQDQKATSTVAIDSTDDAVPLHVDAENYAQQPATPPSPAVVDSNHGDEELSQSDITPIQFPDPDRHPQPGLDPENHDTSALPEPSQEPHIPSHTGQTDTSEEGKDTQAEYPWSGIGESSPLPVHEGPVPILSTPVDFDPSFLGGFVQSTTVAPPSFPIPVTVSHTTVQQQLPSTTIASTPLSNYQGEPAENTQPLKAEITGPSWPEIEFPNPLPFPSPEIPQPPSPGLGPLKISPPKPQRRLLRKKTRPTMFTLDSQKDQMETQYVNMLLALDAIPAGEGRKANFFTWILMAGFVIFPGTFKSLPNLGEAGVGAGTAATVAQHLLHVISHVPLFIVGWVCTAIGGLGMLWLAWRWHKNHIWVLRRIFIPGFKSSLTGFISTINIIRNAQHGQLGGSSMITLIVVCATTSICLFLTVIYSYWLKSHVRAKHDSEVGVQMTGRYGEGVADPSKRKAEDSDVEAGKVNLGIKKMIWGQLLKN